MNLTQRFCVFDNNIISDVFGEEVVLVNLESGVYYSLRDSATQFWIRIFNHYSIEEISQELLSIYDLPESELHSEINQFINQLLETKIIKESDKSEKNELDSPCPTEKRTFISPVLETFSDMQEILLLDPVHDVDKDGWPISNKGTSDN